MNRRNSNSARLKPATSCLAGLLGLLLLILAVGAGAHREHADGPGHQDCAVCLIAHGGVLADGAIGAPIVTFTSCFVLPTSGETKPVFVLDLRLDPGRATPV